MTTIKEEKAIIKSKIKEQRDLIKEETALIKENKRIIETKIKRIIETKIKEQRALIKASNSKIRDSVKVIKSLDQKLFDLKVKETKNKYDTLEGKSFYLWKKCTTRSGTKALVKLKVPKTAKVVVSNEERNRISNIVRWGGTSSANDLKLRVSEAKVMAVYDYKYKDNKLVLVKEFKTPVHSFHDHSFKYKKGKIVKPHFFNSDKTLQCAGGIHGFLTKERAINY